MCKSACVRLGESVACRSRVEANMRVGWGSQVNGIH